MGRKCDFVKCMDPILKERLGAVLRKWEVRVLSVLDEGDADQAQFRPQKWGGCRSLWYVHPLSRVQQEPSALLRLRRIMRSGWRVVGRGGKKTGVPTAVRKISYMISKEEHLSPSSEDSFETQQHECVIYPENAALFIILFISCFSGLLWDICLHWRCARCEDVSLWLV